jgi:hypothetical protein
MYQAPDDWFLIAPAIACFPLHARFVMKPQLPHPPLSPPRRRPLASRQSASWSSRNRVLALRWSGAGIVGPVSAGIRGNTLCT